MGVLPLLVYAYMGGVVGTILGMFMMRETHPELFKQHYIFDEYIFLAGLLWPVFVFMVIKSLFKKK